MHREGGWDKVVEVVVVLLVTLKIYGHNKLMKHALAKVTCLTAKPDNG